MIIGTTSIKEQLNNLSILDGYNDIIHIPSLSISDAQSVVKIINNGQEVLTQIKNDIPIKELLFKIDML